MTWIFFIPILSFIFGFQPRPFAELIAINSEQATLENHEHTQKSTLEILKTLIGGSFTHSHEHSEKEAGTHEHAHEHHYNGTISGAVFIVAQINFSFRIINQVWRTHEKLFELTPYFSEILKPPILS